ncbi:NUDIX domain-containing protein [Bacillus timonensis]|nr:NUDIX domain-containing protein [Bacillus timonensis]
MQTEQLTIFDNERNPVGTASREEVHQKGYWHEVFHCWFMSKEEDIDYIYLQLRSQTKKDYPNLLDITAAGHLLADETVEDGVREIKEEIGIDVSFQELIPLGVIDYSVERDGFKDNELANVFLSKIAHTFCEFTLQEEEVSGIYQARFEDFEDLWLERKQVISIIGFEVNQDGGKVNQTKAVQREDFVPHPEWFYQAVIERLKVI